MVSDQETHSAGAAPVESEASHHTLADPESALGVIAALAFPDIVKKGRQIKRADVPHLTEYMCQFRQVVARLARQQVKSLHRFQCMLVYRIPVVRIVLDQKRDSRELGNEPAEESCLMHHPQRGGNPTPTLQDLEEGSARFF